ncbi:hypothetical protein CDL12_22868 [Handroanthus impetiginosus]|uniref:GED domain-containing protein n=1 Tax=Handroanthus impetiginosus TaxID=429701 RepID=A0A2G9GHV5_9LAMI|nr:hypothetical protein CDL12_22868 [Handroanthus impetiginosus]
MILPDKHLASSLRHLMESFKKQALGGLSEKVTMDDESYEEVREEEAKLFDNQPLLSKINKSIVGIPTLAERLAKIQATIIVKCFPGIVRKINDKLSSNVEELNKLPRNLTSIGEAMIAFMRILGSAKESLRKILLRGEFDEYPDEHDMHYIARLAEMLNQYSEEMQSKCSTNETKSGFLLDEICVLEETKTIGLPNFLPRAVFLTLLQKNIKGISFAPIEFVEKIWDYIENVVVSVLMRHSDNYPQLLSSTRRAAQNLVSKKRKQSVDWVIDIVEMEKLTDYTCNPEYVSLWNKLMAHQNAFMEALNHGVLGPHCMKPTNLHMDGYGDVDVNHLRSHVVVAHEAFDLKSRLAAYWKIVLRRLVDCMALHLLFSVQNLVSKEIEMEIINELVGPSANGLERMLEELNNSIKLLLKESKDVVSKITDRIAAYVN